MAFRAQYFCQKIFITVTGIEDLTAPARSAAILQTVSRIFMHILEWKGEQFFPSAYVVSSLGSLEPIQVVEEGGMQSAKTVR